MAPPPSANDGRARAGGDGLSVPRDERIQIIADEANNAPLILARGSDYQQILGALRQLDVSPMQVLIEVTIAQVLLTDKWFLPYYADIGAGDSSIDTVSWRTRRFGSFLPHLLDQSHAHEDLYNVMNGLTIDSFSDNGW